MSGRPVRPTILAVVLLLRPGTQVVPPRSPPAPTLRSARRPSGRFPALHARLAAKVGADFFFHGIEAGCGFGPDVVVTGALRLPLVRIGPDVAEDAPHVQGIDRVTLDSVATGHFDGRFDPDDPVTRAQMSTFRFRALSDRGAEGGDRSWLTTVAHTALRRAGP